MHVTGEPDKSPLRINFPLSYGLASIQAALGSMIAFTHRQNSGRGQHVDVSVQENVIFTICNVLPTWDLNNIMFQRSGVYWFRGGLGQKFLQRVLWPCLDGYIAYMVVGGPVGAKSNSSLVKWMDEEGMADDLLITLDWNAFDIAKETQAFHDEVEKKIMQFFMTHTRDELSEGAKRRGILLQIVSTAQDIMESKQLAARDFWTCIDHPELGTKINYPGMFVKSLNNFSMPDKRAPLIGENNQEIYQEELGLSSQSLDSFKKKGII